MSIKKILLLFYLSFVFQNIQAQICGSPGKDGAQANPLKVLNTYYLPASEMVLSAGARQIMLSPVYQIDEKDAGMVRKLYGDTPISAGDLLIIIQMQDALINLSDDANYGANDPFSGPDRLGGTGYMDLGNSGKYEYVLATNSVPLAGGLLTFRGSGSGMGTVNAYTSAAPNALRGSRTFQVIRVPQYSNLTLDLDKKNVTVPRFYKKGGVLAFNVSGILNLNGHYIDVSEEGFSGGAPGRGFERDDDYYNRNNVYAQFSMDYLYNLAGKASGVGGSPRFGFPGGTRGKGAPGNAGGAGYLNVAGGGGGGNGGAGGVGGNGARYGDPRDTFPNGGRPGSSVYNDANLERLILGGGGGAGDTKDYGSLSVTPPGGAVVIINSKQITGTGSILSNGYGADLLWWEAIASDINPGSGGGAGGTIFINELNGDLSANINLTANGGNGSYSALESTVIASGGPGGGGGGGQIFCSMSPSRVKTAVRKGNAGTVYGTGDTKFAADGQDGNVKYFSNNDLPPHLMYSICFPELNTSVSQSDLTARYYAGGTLSYMIRVRNLQPSTAAGVRVEVQLPIGFIMLTATAGYSGDASGP